MQAVGINLNPRGVRAHWNLPLFELLGKEYGTTDLETQW